MNVQIGIKRIGKGAMRSRDFVLSLTHSRSEVISRASEQCMIYTYIQK